MLELSIDLKEKMESIAGKDAFVFYESEGEKDGTYAFYPSSSEELSRFSSLCYRHRVPMRPCSDETSARSDRVNVFFDRMDKVLSVDPVSRTITVQAGCTFETARRAADEAGFLFPLYMNAPEGARIGGRLATNYINAGVFRYGTPKELTLGTQLVLPDGTVKDTLENYATSESDTMKNLFVGSHGSIGFITAAVIRLHPKAAEVRRMLCLCDGLSGISKLFALSQHLGATLLTGFDVFSKSGMEEILKEVPSIQKPFEASWYVLIEFSSTVANDRLGSFLEELKKEAVQKGLIRDAVTSKYAEDAENLARMERSVQCLARCADGAYFKEAVLPVSKTVDFLERLGVQAAYAFPKASLMPLARMGEGALFLNVRFSELENDEAALTESEKMFKLFDTLVCQAGGMCAVSQKAGGSADGKGEIADMIRALKASFDPYNLMNPT